MGYRRLVLVGTLVIAMGAVPSAVRAQAAGPARAPVPATDDPPQLDDIVVTAQRREESATRVPISITVVGGEALSRRAVSTLQDLTLNVANFQITQTGLTTQAFIRGIGSGTDVAFEQSVAQYVDGINYGRAQLTRAPFFDVQRVEVLRGPQSILFGKNSTAGAVSVINAQPTDALHAGATTTYTPAFHQIESTGFLSGPIANGLEARVALRGLSDGGFVYNTVKDSDEPKRHEFGVRGTLRFDGLSSFRATLKGEYSRFTMIGRDLEVVRDVPTATIAAGPLAGLPQTYANALALIGLPNRLVDTSLNYRRQTDQAEFDRTNLYNGTLTTETDIGRAVLTTITGYVSYQRRTQVDLDFTAANIILGSTRENSDQFSQEVRLATRADAAISFVGGLYYEYGKIAYSDITGFGPDIARLGAAYAPLANVGVVRDFGQTTNSYAAFGQATWRATDRLRLIAGGRVTRDDKDGFRRIVARLGQVDYDGTLVTSPTQIAILQAGLRYSLDNVGGAGHNLAGSRGKVRFVPSAIVEFDASPDVLLFASYKEGYKAGGFDARGNNNRVFGFEDETAQAFEGGLRARRFDNRGSFSLTGYHSIYRNLQISQFDGTVGFNVGNAGRTRTQGVEAEARYAITRGITASAAASYLDFKYLDFKRGNCAFGEVPNGDTVGGVRLCDYTGRTGRFAPKWNLSGSLALDQPLSGTLNLRGSLDASYKSSHNVHDNLDALGVVEGYTIVDARIGVGGDRWDVAVVGRNLLDENFITFAANVPFASAFGANTQYASVSRPRSVAVQLSLRY